MNVNRNRTVVTAVLASLAGASTSVLAQQPPTSVADPNAEEIVVTGTSIRGVAPVGLLAATVTLVPLYTDPAGSTGPLAMVEHTGHGWAIPWLPVMLVLCLGALVAVLVARKRRRPAQQETLPQDAGTVAHAQEPPGA